MASVVLNDGCKFNHQRTDGLERILDVRHWLADWEGKGGMIFICEAVVTILDPER